MSILASRSAASEGAYFYKQSKLAVTKLIQNNPNLAVNKLIQNNPKLSNNSNSTPHFQNFNINNPSDVLPEILKHSLPSKIFHSHDFDHQHKFSGSKWVLKNSNNFKNLKNDALNPLKGYVSLPQVTFGPRRWQLPESESSVLASTANELRRDKYTPVNPEKLKAAAVGLTQIAKAFAVATTIVLGSATLIFGTAVSKLDLRNGDDVKTKGKDLIQPKLEMVKDQLLPLKNWAKKTSKKWHLERDENIKEKPIVKEFSRILGARPSN